MVGAVPRAWLAGLLILLLPCRSDAFYVPGWSVKSYKDGERVPLLVNKIYSDNTQLPFAFHELPFVCKPMGRRSAGGGLLSGQSIPLNLGEVLRGDRIVASDMELVMGQDEPCVPLCTQNLSRQDIKRAYDLVRGGYVAEWLVDNLPGATSFVTSDRTKKYYAAGFKLGYTEAAARHPRSFLYNHHTIVIRYRKAYGRDGEAGKKLIVGFEVYPKSIGHGTRRNSTGCPADLVHVDEGLELRPSPNRTEHREPRQTSLAPAAGNDDDDDEEVSGEASLSVPYTYSVYFREDDSIEWAHRWDLYFVNQEEGSRIHWLAIVNSLIICWLLTGIVIIILARTVRTDIRAYNNHNNAYHCNNEASSDDGQTGRSGRTGKSCNRRRLRAAAAAAAAAARVPSPPAGHKSPGLLDRTADEKTRDADESMEEEEEGCCGAGDGLVEDVTGWKLLHADVFRKPRAGGLLAPLVGSGMQLLLMAVGLVLLSALGVLNPSFRGGFVSVGVGLFVAAGLFSGYFSARVFKSFEGTDYRRNALVTALLFPGLTFALVFILNLFVWAQASSTAMPFGTLVGILVLWLGIQVPLVLAGSRYGYLRAGAWEHPTGSPPPPPPTTTPTMTTTTTSKTRTWTRTKTAAAAAAAAERQVPRQAWYIRSLQSILLAGLIPFAVIFIELLFVFQSVWQDKSGYYYVFGFLAAVSAVLLVTVAEVTVVTIYIQLCSENHEWWWQSFLVGGGSAVWVFGYCIWYYAFKLHISGVVSSLLFFAYSFMACCVYGLLTGTVGFLSAYAFVRRIYGFQGVFLLTSGDDASCCTACRAIKVD